MSNDETVKLPSCTYVPHIVSAFGTVLKRPLACKNASRVVSLSSTSGKTVFPNLTTHDYLLGLLHANSVNSPTHLSNSVNSLILSSNLVLDRAQSSNVDVYCYFGFNSHIA